MSKTSQTISVLEQNRLEDGITITVHSTNPDAVGRSSLSLTEFLRRFETPKERAVVRTAVHAALRASRR
ncbi:MAG: hypothetical protein JNK25_03450 [Phycisphaerae bacterium]|nr:hypothetical protein [Phycisphaerae bacterium]